MFEKISVGAASRAKPAAVVVAVFKDKKLDRATGAVDGQIGRAINRGEFSGDPGSVVETFPEKGPGRVIVVGLGERKDFKPAVLRSVAAAVGRRLAGTKDTPVQIAIHHALKSENGGKSALTEAGRAFGEGLGLIGWNYSRFRGSAAKNNNKPGKLSVVSDDSALTAGLRAGLALAESTNIARDLSQTPPNIATTAYIASQARALARQTGMTCRVIQGAELEKERLEGLLNVGKASEHGPCLIRLEYRPSGRRGGSKGRGRSGGAKAAKPVVLVGKTMVYDSGGLSLKINNGMVGMKRDKDGGCAVFGAMHAIATQIKPDVPVVALLSCAENAISDEAYRPDDVLTFRNGVTVEVTNTDAEGRLVLADALCWACDRENPACIIDLATLTGGVVVALGATFAGLWCDDDKLRARLERAMEASGERWWRLPHDSEYRELMRSPIADILNSAPVRQAHPIQGAAFLSYFVKEGIPWAHIDIAGVHATESDKGPFVKGPTGWGVRLLAQMLAEW